MPVVALGALAIGTSAYGAHQQNRAAKSAAEIQSGAAQAGIESQERSTQLAIDEQKRQFDALQKLLSPYVQAGQGGLSAYQNLLGVNTPQAQQQAIAQLQQSPQFASMMQQGENAILQNASATGGLRGGNTQAALAQFRPQLLNQLIQQQLQGYSGLATMGQNSAAGVGSAGMNLGSNIGNLYSNLGTNQANLLGQMGAAQAGAKIAGGQARAGMANSLLNLGGQLYGMGAF